MGPESRHAAGRTNRQSGVSRKTFRAPAAALAAKPTSGATSRLRESAAGNARERPWRPSGSRGPAAAASPHRARPRRSPSGPLAPPGCRKTHTPRTAAQRWRRLRRLRMAATRRRRCRCAPGPSRPEGRLRASMPQHPPRAFTRRHVHRAARADTAAFTAQRAPARRHSPPDLARRQHPGKRRDCPAGAVPSGRRRMHGTADPMAAVGARLGPRNRRAGLPQERGCRSERGSGLDATQRLGFPGRDDALA